MKHESGSYADVSGLKMYYELHGDADDPVPLVLLHGGGSTIETSFGRTIDSLARTRRVIAFEQQGHGHTADIAERPFSFSQSASDTVALLKYLGVDKADLIGFSNGGHISIQIAIDHPEVVRKLVIISAMFKREGADPQFWESFKHAKLHNMPLELRNAYREVAPNPDGLQSFFEKSVQRMDTFRDWTADQLKSIGAPALVLAGDRDVLSVEHAVEMFRLLPNSQLGILPGTDHMMIMERPDVLVPMINLFLDALVVSPG